ncbi:MAG: DUF3348 domain-containing protein [Rubrivivax sp.]|nr:MAG: DUF3348 domain-containing protein [Rubrivivax sp.]
MVQMSRHAGPAGSALVRLLVRLTNIDAPESRQSFSERLSQWLRWNDAISLSAALNGNASPAAAAATRAPSGTPAAECQRVRAALTRGIEQAPTDAATDFAACRRHCLARQQAMEIAIAPLRERLRALLAARSPALARLAAVDAVMEQALGAREHTLLQGVPALLEQHFKRLAQTEPQNLPGPWLDIFHQDMRAVLLAELDLRLQPVEGLLEALRPT